MADDAQWLAEIDEPEQPDPKKLLMAYMLRDGYTGAEVQAYLDLWPSHFPPAESTEKQSDYVLDGSPEAVAIVREARGLPPLNRPDESAD